jgi:hypothetical protein
MEEDEALPTAHAPVKASRGSSSTNSSKSNSYFVSEEDPVAAAATELGASGAKLIGGNIIGSLRFESQDREHDFLSKPEASFYFPLMEKELMKTAAPNMLRCVQDLALKTFVATRCAAHQVQAEASSSSLRD